MRPPKLMPHCLRAPITAGFCFKGGFCWNHEKRTGRSTVSSTHPGGCLPKVQAEEGMSMGAKSRSWPTYSPKTGAPLSFVLPSPMPLSA